MGIGRRKRTLAQKVRLSEDEITQIRARLHEVPLTTTEVLREIGPKAEARERGIRLRTFTTAMDWGERVGRKGDHHPVYRGLPDAVQTVDVDGERGAKQVVESYAELNWLMAALGPGVVREWLRSAREGIEVQLLENQVRRG